jgi:imidazoleglycerol-phosphate dehydratase
VKIAFIIYDGMSNLDFAGVYEPLARLKSAEVMANLELKVNAVYPDVCDSNGLRLIPAQVGQPLESYDLLIIPGGPGVTSMLQDSQFMTWLKSGASCSWKTAMNNGTLLLGAAGFLQGKKATTSAQAYADLKPFCASVLEQPLVDSGDVISTGDIPAINLGLYLCEKLAGSEAATNIQKQLGYSSFKTISAVNFPSTTFRTSPRLASLTRRTNETSIDVNLNLDGSGKHEIQSGIGFLDHMLTHIAVHGLIDLKLTATGDLDVDSHHTVEDVALTLGKTFDQALGDRAGIVRMASVSVPMDESLALLAIDFSGRPYTQIQTKMHTPAVGGIATSLFPHFLESFAMAARCNLHAQVKGRDDHHQAEALFKALGRALEAATRIDPRRSNSIPSTKGTLIA